MSERAIEFNGVTIKAKANVFFDGKVISHSILMPDGSRKSIGTIFPGRFHFGTELAERMEITAGECEVKIDGSSDLKQYCAGQQFEVAAKSGFTIDVKSGLCEYVCTFIAA